MSRRFHPLCSSKLLAGDAEQVAKRIAELRFPLLACPKYDGWRIFEYNGEATTRSLKPPKNYHVRRELARFYARCVELGLKGADGELVVGSPTDFNAMQNTTSGVGTYEGTPELTYFVFDSYQFSDRPYQERYQRVRDLLTTVLPSEFPWIRLVEYVTVHDWDQLLAYEAEVLAQGFEGIMLRKPDGLYKWGRSTDKEQILIAVKRWATFEGVILEVREQQSNTNEATVGAYGRTERSSHQAGLVGKDTFGAALLKSTEFTDTFSVGNGRGLTDAVRAQLWAMHQRGELVGKIVQGRHFDIGSKTRPRHPQWVSLRDPDDMEGQE